MKKHIIIMAAIFLLSQSQLYSKQLSYKEFVLGNKKENIIKVLNKKKYSQQLVFYENNDRRLGSLKIKSENSIKIIIKKYMEKEEILLAFDRSNILFDIYTKKTPMDIRDYIDHQIYLINKFGTPTESVAIREKHILTWRLNKKRHAIYMIYDIAHENIIINYRDTYLNMKYL